MKKSILLLSFSVAFSLSTSSYANWFADIVNRIEKTNVINMNILDSQNAMLNTQRDILSSQRDVESLIKQMNGSLNGNSGWGTYNFHDYQSYGDSASDWLKVLEMAEYGGGSGVLGQVMNALANQFPIETNNFNKGITDSTTQKYYDLQSKTVLATRAASQLDYNKIHEQLAYQQMLQQQIEKAKDLKGAVDLNNRIQVEANLINLEILRQSSLANQQQAINTQASINSALLNAKFLTKYGGYR